MRKSNKILTLFIASLTLSEVINPFFHRLSINCSLLLPEDLQAMVPKNDAPVTVDRVFSVQVSAPLLLRELLQLVAMPEDVEPFVEMAEDTRPWIEQGRWNGIVVMTQLTAGRNKIVQGKVVESGDTTYETESIPMQRL